MDLPNKSATPPKVKKPARQVVPKGLARSASRPASKRFFEFMFAESPKTILVGVVTNTLVPRMKAAGEEAINGFLHGMLWGGGSSPVSQIVRGTVLSGDPHRRNYAALSAPGTPLAPTTAGIGTGPYQDVIVPTQEFAEAVLANLYADLNDYSQVAVGDLYESAGLTPEPHHNSYGWYNLDGASIMKERDGYRIALPRPVRI